jgi:hypothetical protein
MQFKNLISVALASVVLAANPVADTLETISQGLSTLGGNINSWNGDVVAAAGLLTQAQDLLAVIEKAVPSVNSSPSLPLTEAVNILKPANQVVKQTQATIDAMIAKKGAFAKAELSSVVKDTISKFKGAASTLVGAVKTKLPDNVKAVAGSIAKQIDAAIEKGIAAYA